LCKKAQGDRSQTISVECYHDRKGVNRHVSDVQTLLHQAKQLTSDERLELVRLINGLEHALLREENHLKPDYLALFGSGRGGYATPDEADEFIRKLSTNSGRLLLRHETRGHAFSI
jgi:hypothetical protein